MVNSALTVQGELPTVGHDRDLRQISRGKFDRVPCVVAESKFCVLDGNELRENRPAHLGEATLNIRPQTGFNWQTGILEQVPKERFDLSGEISA
jgi:hypothetical protein